MLVISWSQGNIPYLTTKATNGHCEILVEYLAQQYVSVLSRLHREIKVLDQVALARRMREQWFASARQRKVNILTVLEDNNVRLACLLTIRFKPCKICTTGKKLVGKQALTSRYTDVAAQINMVVSLLLGAFFPAAGLTILLVFAR